MIPTPDAPRRDLRRDLEERGTLVFSAHESPFTETEWELLESLVDPATLPYESVLAGDTGEQTHLEVGRFLTDVRHVQIVNAAATHRLMTVIASSRLNRLYSELTGMNPVYIRRAQVNRMRTGSFIGLHLDKESNPDYRVSVVLQFGRYFEGGEFVLHRGETREVHIPAYRSTIISLCSISHEVAKVTAGERVSLVYFLCDHYGENRRCNS